MNKVKVATVAGLTAALVFGAACSINRSSGDEPEVNVPCYTVDGDFVKWDDDCHDDKDSKGRRLVVGPPSGLKTAGQPAPSKPAPGRTRR